MNAEQLLQHFERISEAPDAIPRLRRFILDLAVRGKLVEQEPSDEPASELLKRIAAEKARVGVKHAVESLNRDEVPFELPPGWSWSRIGEACSKTGSGSTPRGGKDVYKKAGTIFLRSQNVYDDGLRLNEVAYIDRVTHEKMSATRVLPGDLLLNITGGSMGRCCLVSADAEEANVSQHVAIIRAAVRGTESFLHKLVLSPYFQAFVFGEQTGAGRGGLPKNRMDKIAVALPPLAEQHRIVAKVDELMALCDQLDAAKAEREKCRDSLVAASLQGLNQPAEEAENFREHARFTFNNLPRITTRAAHIKQLRQTILNLAVRGKLVEQDPRDESAAEWYRRASKRVLSAECALGVPQFQLPSGWLWLRVASVFDVAGGIQKTPHRTPLNNAFPYLGVSNVYRGRLDLSKVKEFELEPGELQRRKLEAGDLLIIEGNGSFSEIGRCAKWNGEINDCVHQNHVIRCRPFDTAISNFTILFLNSPNGMEIMQRLAITSSGLYSLSVGKIRQIEIPLPPLAEQQRIVAKVDELMAICDQLETQITAMEQDSRRFLESVLADALAPGIDLSTEAEVA